MKKTALMLMAAVSLIAGATGPALAGTVTLDNTKGAYAYKVRVDSYAFGIPSTAYLCAETGKTQYLGNALSIGIIYVNAAPSGCANFSHTFDIAKPYKVPGTWLPHRGFKVITNEHGGYRVTEG
ncbi:hypothetical protein FY034_03060 [Trichlorobacter lovleyi]|uniref:hypothetical protein n=1 Tax=Trichlorobacter lovleyi TaxID=313985 RepID=UPI002240490A|nr:hypothetical protein [Trichlorobacter lovleyi]QOX77961.1 hypothetical protein FY034_03060 [Trichlorobacter lovleyi]